MIVKVSDKIEIAYKIDITNLQNFSFIRMDTLAIGRKDDIAEIYSLKRMHRMIQSFRASHGIINDIIYSEDGILWTAGSGGWINKFE